MLIEQLLLNEFVNNFQELLLSKLNVLDMFDMGNFFQIFVISRNTDIIIESNFLAGMYVSYILNINFNSYIFRFNKKRKFEKGFFYFCY